MAILSVPQVYAAARAGGWPEQGPTVTMVAIAMAESGGDTAAIGDVDLQTAKWGPSVGLTQIRSLNADKGTGRTRDEIANRDPVVNMRHAYEISSGGTNFTPWSAYNNGAWKRFLVAAGEAAAKPVGPGQIPGIIEGAITDPGGAVDAAGQIIGGALDPLASVAAFLGKLADPALWRRLGLGALGVGVIVVALVFLSRDLITRTAGDVAKAATS